MKSIFTDLSKVKANRMIFSLSALFLSGFIIRLYFFPFGLPVSLDGIDYFSFAYSLSKNGEFPKGILGTNDGWAILLGTTFKIINNYDYQTLHFIQRFTSVVISCLTVFPVFYLCKKFSNDKCALIGAAIFISDFRIIENSLLGITEPLFIFLSTCAIVFGLRRDQLVYFSFILVGLASIVRYEALLLVIPISIIICKDKGKQNKKTKIVIGLLLLILTLLPIYYLRTQTNGYDGLTSHLIAGPQHVLSGTDTDGFESTSIVSNQVDKIGNFLFNAVFGTSKFLIWDMIPVYVIFVPVGLYYAIKKRSEYLMIWMTFSVFMLIPGFYAYGRGIEETRYLYVLFPIFCTIASFFVLETRLTSNKKSLFIIIGIFVLSIVALQLHSTDYTYDKEIYEVTKKLVPVAVAVNDYPGSKYIKVATLDVQWPQPLSTNEAGDTTYLLRRIPTADYDSLMKYILDSEKSGLTHIVVTKNNKSGFLDELLEGYQKYPFLIKEFDSDENDYKNKIMIFKIDYNMLRGNS